MVELIPFAALLGTAQVGNQVTRRVCFQSNVGVNEPMVSLLALSCTSRFVPHAQRALLQHTWRARVHFSLVFARHNAMCVDKQIFFGGAGD